MPRDVYLKKCKQHPQELVKFYCLSCEVTACSTCKTTLHSWCRRVCHLPKLVSEFEKEKECSDIENSFDLLEKKMAGIEVIIINNKTINEQYHADAESTLRKQKEKAESIFNNSEQEIEKIHSSNKNLLDMEAKSYDLLKEDIKNLKLKTGRLKKSSQKCMVFLEIKSVKEEKKHILKKLDDLEVHLKHMICKYSYKLASKELKPDSFGKVTAESHGGRKLFIGFLVFAVFSMIGSIDKFFIVKVKTEISVEKLPNIQLHFTPKLICYHSDNSFLIFDTKDEMHVYNPKGNNWTDKIITKFKYKPTEITKVNDDIIALKGPRYVGFYVVSSHQLKVYLKIVKQIHIDAAKFQLIQYKLGKLFAMYDNILTIFDDHENEWNYVGILGSFKEEDMAVSPSGKTIYISEKIENTLISYTTEGKFVATYKNETLKDPRRMAVDNKGNLFVCGYSSHNIFYVSADLTYGYEILNESHGIYYPEMITYNERESILYITTSSSFVLEKSIQVFKINTKETTTTEYKR